MAQRVQVMLVCDLHDGEVAGSETVSFGVDGSGYEIDVCEEHAAEIRDSFAAYVGAARRAGRTSAGTTRRATRPGRAAAGGDKQRTVEIREWARAHGHAVNERGRLPRQVVEAYDAAH